MFINLRPKAKEHLLKFKKKQDMEMHYFTVSLEEYHDQSCTARKKRAGEKKHYRPISLTTCIGKLAERMVNYRLYLCLAKNEILNNSNAGFRRGTRTDDQLFRLCKTILYGFQE